MPSTIFCADFSPIRSRSGELLCRKRIKIRQRFDDALIHELIDQRRPQSFDIHCASGGKETETFFELRRARRIQAADIYAALIAADLASANGTVCRELKWLFLAGPFLQFHPHDVRDNFPGFFHNDMIADPDILAGDFVRVMQADARHLGARDFNGFEFRHRRQRARFADLHVDVLDLCARLPEFHFVGDDPAGGFAGCAELLALADAVDLDNQAIRFIIERTASFECFPAVIQSVIDVLQHPAVRHDRNAESAHPIEKLVMGFQA